jgi:hypothetical protein
MNKHILILITSLLVFSNIGLAKTKTIKNLNKEITKLTKLTDKQDIKITKLTTSYKNSFENSKLLKEEGDALITLGENGQLESLSKYVSFVGQMGKAQSSNELKAEIKLLKSIQSKWHDFDKNIKSGEKAQNKSAKSHIKATKLNEELTELIRKFERNKSKLNSLKEQKELLQTGR